VHVTRRAAIAGVVAVLCGAPAEADIYQWTDAEGHTHFTEHLDRVPPAQRAAAQESARPEGQRGVVQTYASPAPPASAARSRLSRELRIPFERDGTLMRVSVRLNDRLTVPFYVDTGASGIALPPRYAESLGLRIGRDTPQVVVSTANGSVSNPLVRLASVELGGARVEGLDATVNPSMQIGLLGGSFFNNFVYRVDAAEGVITLAPNEGMRGGLDAEAWRARFGRVRGLLDRLEAHLASATHLPDDERAVLEGRRAELRAALQALDREADRQRVPQNWRE
jgi:clan AA aspartic protease (TIGR02281 family)